MVTPRAKPDSATLRTRSSTSWMLTGWRAKPRVSPKLSMRSIRPRMRSLSAMISWVISRSAGRQRFFQQLRRAANAGQRVLDLMRQHRRHAVHGAHRAPRHQLAVHALGQAAFLEGEQHGAFRLGHRRHGHIGDALAMLGRGKIDVALGGRGVALAPPGRPAGTGANAARSGRPGSACAGWSGRCRRTARRPDWRRSPPACCPAA